MLRKYISLDVLLALVINISMQLFHIKQTCLSTEVTLKLLYDKTPHEICVGEFSW